MKNIIFIEGVSGVGKSTTVNLLGETLRSLGFSVKCHNEGDPDGPLDLCWVAYLTIPEYEELLNTYPLFVDEFSKNIIFQNEYILLRYQVGQAHLYSYEIYVKLHNKEFCYNPNTIAPLSKFTEVFLNLWHRYAESKENECDYAIFDASLVSHMTSDMIRNYNANIDEMVEHITTLLQAIYSLNPIVFYLSSHDVRERLIKARKNRGQTPLDDKQIEFWGKRKQIDMAVIPKLSVESHIIDIANDNWNSVISEIISMIIKR